MERQVFNDMLQKAELSKEDFAEKVGLKYRSVNNWGTASQNVPHWVQSWLELYIESNSCKRLKKIIKTIKEE